MTFNREKPEQDLAGFIEYALTGRTPAPEPSELAERESYQGHRDQPSPAQRLRAGRCLANVQRLQSEFWQALRDLEDAIEDIQGDDCELDGAKDFNDFDLEDVLEGRANDGEEE